MTQVQPSPKIRPIILGADIGSYATARAFHEAYGVQTVIIAGTRIGPVADSGIVDLRVVPNLELDLVAAVRSVMAEQPESVHLILGSVDWWVSKLVQYRAALEPAIIPYAPRDVIDRVMDKAEFARLCAAVDVPHPHTTVVRPGGDLPSELPEPMVVKAADPRAFNEIEFEGKKKVEYLNERRDLEEYLRRVSTAGFDGEFVVQEFVPGGDDAMATVNAFYGPDGAAHFFVYGRVLLEEHTPNGLGNSVAQITGSAPDHPAVQAAKRLLDHLGWVGFANLDLKIRGDEYLFFELNPRVGRSGYAVTAAGYNSAKHYVEAFVEGRSAPAEPDIAAPSHLFTVVPTGLLKRYAPKWRGEIDRLKRKGNVTNAYYYRAEKNPKRWFYIVVAMANQYRKFARYHPANKRK